MKIARLGPGDADRLRHLRLSSLSDTPDAFASTYERSAQKTAEDWDLEASTLATFLAVSNGNDIGIVRAAPDQHDEEGAWLLSMWVAAQFRRQGVGDALVEAAVTWARHEGFTRLQLDVGDWNTPAIALYTRHGFEATGETGHLPSPREHIAEHRRVLILTG